MESALLFGHSASWWDGVMLLSLAVAAFVALAVAGATAGSVVANKREAASAKAELDRFRTDAGAKIAEAHRDAAQAREVTESIRSENLKLEAKIQPRRLSKEQLSALAASLEQFKDKKIRVESYALDAEGQVFAGQIRDALSRVFVIDDWVAMESADNGFVLGISVTGTDTALVNALVGALQGQSIVGVTTKPPPEPRVVGLAVSIAREKAGDVSAVVLVGIKPIEQ